MHTIAYNLVRLTMTKAGRTHKINHRRTTSKGLFKSLRNVGVDMRK